MKNILVPTDFSDNCQKAAHLAIKMAVLYKAEIHFLHQLHTPVDWVKLNKTDEHNYPEILKKIGKAKNNLRVFNKEAVDKGLTSRTFLEFISDNNAIATHTHDFQHDFIITGSKGTEKGFLNEILGSNVQKIIRKAHVPILIVKDEQVTFPFKNIVFVSDYNLDEVNAFERVLNLAKKINAKLHLLHINTDSISNNVNNGLQSIKKFVKQFPKLENFEMHIYNSSTVLGGIENFEESNDMDLIAMNSHMRDGVFSVFSKSIAESVTNHSKKPIIITHL
ncbi:universal stress protein [Polaribacter haliotis]|uniref:Universal stress protein n=1 Tax=Polaribacter haliotis TaxID=1888915 RepID=A0A7L8AIL5_9FLAO|nr:universal stress protein [Polaribacter haliotis]QOD61845.1 universal stress protein [Polaribacter haliotis]